jgi:hypothetical protein
MPELETELSALLAHLAERAPHDPALASRVRARARRRRWAAAVAASLLVLGGAGMVWQAQRTDSAVMAAGPCAEAVTERVLPSWATYGFSDPHPVIKYATSRSGNIVALLFGSQLSAPPDAEVNNKVLWVSQSTPAATVHVHATLEGTPVATDVVLTGGWGPSYVDMPRPGCWRMDLTWPGGQDQIWLPYRPPLHPLPTTPSEPTTGTR